MLQLALNVPYNAPRGSQSDWFRATLERFRSIMPLSTARATLLATLLASAGAALAQTASPAAPTTSAAPAPAAPAPAAPTTPAPVATPLPVTPNAVPAPAGNQATGVANANGNTTGSANTVNSTGNPSVSGAASSQNAADAANNTNNGNTNANNGNGNNTNGAGGDANGATGDNSNGAGNGADNTNGAGGTSPAAPANPNALPERGTYRIEGDAENMSVYAVGVDAAELLTAIASKSSLQVLVDDAVSRRLTVSIAGRPARQIVSDVAAAYGLGIGDIDNTLMISEGIPRAAGSYVLSQIESVQTKYVDASLARNLLPVFLQDYVKVNSEQNAVVLSAPRDVLDKFRDDIARFDTPASQILVDLLVVELTDTTLDQLSFTLGFGNAGRGLFYDSGGGLSYRSVATLPSAFTSTIRALEERGRARVRANPRIATVSGQRASIFVGRQRYIVTPIDTGQGQRNFIDAGVRLGMTPYTGGQGQILIEVDAEVSTLSAVDPITRLPEKSTRTANSTVRVADGQTIIIGGLKQQEQRAVTTRIPILGSIPLIGPLFRSRDIRNTTSDLVIFITPRTLSSTGHLPEAEERRLKGQFLEGPLNSPLPPSAQSVVGPANDPGAVSVPQKNIPPENEGTANPSTANLDAPSGAGR